MKLIFNLHKIIVFIFFFVFLGIGIFILKDYGISWDELPQIEVGTATFNYLMKGDQGLIYFRDRAYGPLFEVVLVALDKVFHLSNNERALHLIRHFVTFLLFYLGLIFFYRLCKKIFHSWRMGLIGSLFLILSPRIFADAFYNSKDIPCLALFIISTYTLINYLENKTFVNAFIHALLSAVLIDVRIVGIIIPFLTFLFTFIDFCVIDSMKDEPKRSYLSIFLYGVYLIALTMLFWPFLWSSPINNFIYSLSAMSHYKWEGTVLYLGQYFKADHLPWHYIPVWIAISTPLTYVITFCFGYVKIVLDAGKNLIQFYRNNKNELVVLLLISLPILYQSDQSIYESFR